MSPRLLVRDLFKRHGGRPVLRGVSFELAPGEVLGLIGENGVGKSTLVNILAGRYPADSGSILLDGEDFDVHSQREAVSRGIGVIRQDLRVNPHLTVAQAVLRSGSHSGMPHDEIRDIAHDALKDRGFGMSPDAKLDALTPLELVMVELARMAIDDVKLVLMDEVGAMFTRREIDDVHDVLETMNSLGVSSIYISHRLAEVKRVCSRVMVLKEGSVHSILDARHTSVDEMASVLLTREQITPADRSAHPRDELVLSVRGLSTEKALRNIDLDLRRGEVLGLTGPARKGGMNQLAETLSGKGDDQLSSGEIILQSEDGAGRGIAYFGIDEQFQYEDSETIARALVRKDGDDEAYLNEVAELRRIIDVIQSLHISASGASEQLRNLSGGDRQKVALKRWLQNAPEVLILNHPTRGLDVRSRQDLYQMLFEHTAEGGSAIFISSDPAELKGWCDRIAIMQEGRVTRIVNPNEITEDELDQAMVAPPVRAMATDPSPAGDDENFEGFQAQRFLII